MALRFFVKIEGTRTTFKGESQQSQRRDQVEGIAFQYSLSLPYDPASGQATGKRQHGTVAMTKAWGAASPQLFQALVNNELLKSVRFEFIRRDPTGVESVFQRITLESAFVASINQHIEPTYVPATANYPELEEIAFLFGRITTENIPGGTTAMDDWAAAPA
jgi:type VI secretion system secreted protein Hcp